MEDESSSLILSTEGAMIHDEASKLPKQYFYFYGSTTSSDATGGGGSGGGIDDNITGFMDTAGVAMKPKTTKTSSSTTTLTTKTLDGDKKENHNVSNNISRHNVNNSNVSNVSLSTQLTDDNSLVGENLVLTDNELDETIANSDDFSQSQQQKEQLMDLLASDTQNNGNDNGASSNKLPNYGSTTEDDHHRHNNNISTNKINESNDNNAHNASHQHGNHNHHHHHHHHHTRSISSANTFSMLHYNECCDKNPWIRHALICMTSSILLLLIAVVFFPNSKEASFATNTNNKFAYNTIEFLSGFTIPFRQIDRRYDFNDPVSNFIEISLFHPSFVISPPDNDNDNAADTSTTTPTSTSTIKCTSSSHRIFTFPFPTGAFWTNLVLPPTADEGISYPIAVYPYAYKWSLSKVQVSYPAMHRIEDSISIHDYFFPDLTLTIIEEIYTRYIIGFDSLSISLRFYNNNVVTPNNDNNKHSTNNNINNDFLSGFETYLVQGSPYITMKYQKVTPIIQSFSNFKNVMCPPRNSQSQQQQQQKQQQDSSTTTSTEQGDDKEQHGKASSIKSIHNNNTIATNNTKTVNDLHKRKKRTLDKAKKRELIGVCTSMIDNDDPHKMILSGIQFIIQTQENINWIVFVSEPVTIVYDTVDLKNMINFTSQFTGIVRIALIPPPSSGPISSSSQDDNIDSMKSSSSTNTGTDSTTTDTKVIMQSTGLQRLIYHAGVYPTSGGVSWSFRDALLSSTSTSSSITSNNHVTKKRVFDAAIALVIGDESLIATNQSSTTTTSTSSSSINLKSGRIGTITFKFETGISTATVSGLSSGNTPKPLLMLALPHHVERLDPSVQLSRDMFDLVYKCIKGPMRPVIGSSWSYDEPLLSMGFDGDSGSNVNTVGQKQQYLDPFVRSKLVESLREDVHIALPTLTENIYGFGKQAARLAQLAHIASMILAGNTTTSQANMRKRASSRGRNNNDEVELGEEDAEVSTLQEQALKVLKEMMVTLLRDGTSDSLVYDVNLGGVVTSDGLLDSHADFGNGRYNDHHFHYGYILYACAILGKLDQSFVDEYANQVDAIYLDIAHDSNLNSKEQINGIFYPGSRHKIWFDGHSFASGLFPFGNGKSQESSSEAVNCYYGAYLWSLVRNGAAEDPDSDISPQTDFARLLLATEIRGAKTYWHMVPPSPLSPKNVPSTVKNTEAATVYTPQFSKNYMVGNLGMLDAICTTWFGTAKLYVHMINLIPVTAITGELFGQKYASLEYKEIIEPLGEVEQAWEGFVIADRAISDPEAAWHKAVDVFSPTLDAGLSKTQLIYWIVTRQGFNSSAVSCDGSCQPQTIQKINSGKSNGSSYSTKESHESADSKAACSNSPLCQGLDLHGNCCPTDGGLFLDCCIYD